MRRKITLMMAVCMLAGTLAGCAKGNDVAAGVDDNAQTKETEVETLTDADNAEEETEETSEWVEERTHESKHASVVLEDDAFVYFCGWEHILRWSKADGSTEKIWVSDKEHIYETSNMYSYDRGILLGDKLYFIERWDETPQNPLSPGMVQALSVVNTDGSGYRIIERIKEGEEAQLILLDGILYYAQETATKALKGFVTDDNGDLLSDTAEVVTEPVNVSEGSIELSMYDNGSHTLSAVESAYRFGYYLLRDENYELCTVDQNTGEKMLLFDKVGNTTPIDFNSTYFLFKDYTNEFLYLVNNNTWENEALIPIGTGTNIIGMDEEWIYWQRYDANEERYYYERVTLDGTLTEGLFDLEAFYGMAEDSPWYLMDITVLGEYIYYVGSQDYKYYLMRRNMSEPWEEEIIGGAFYDSGISKVGSITVYRENIFSDTKPDVILGTTDLEWLIIHDHFPGADKINAILDTEQESYMDYERIVAKDMEEWAEDGLNSSISSRVSPVFYFNERFISFTQQGYEYSGGAHGMPYWVHHTFDLHTGEELDLSFFVANEEEEFRDIVTERFAGMYDVDPEWYWEDAVEMVRESVDFESPFYLKEDGLVIYYGPYELASYAAGFVEIVVPYENLEMKVPVEK